MEPEAKDSNFPKISFLCSSINSLRIYIRVLKKIQFNPRLARNVESENESTLKVN